MFKDHRLMTFFNELCNFRHSLKFRRKCSFHLPASDKACLQLLRKLAFKGIKRSLYSMLMALSKCTNSKRWLCGIILENTLCKLKHWLWNPLAENILPAAHYLNFSGILIDVTAVIFKSFVKHMSLIWILFVWYIA